MTYLSTADHYAEAASKLTSRDLLCRVANSLTPFGRKRPHHLGDLGTIEVTAEDTIAINVCDGRRFTLRLKEVT